MTLRLAMFKSTGKLIYDPRRPGMKNRTEWWCILNVDREITRYYRYWLDKIWWEAENRTVKRNYYQPSWDAHISIIRGERPRKNLQDWGKFKAGHKVEFQYDGIIRQAGDTTGYDRKDYFWFLDTFFPEYNIIRAHFGLLTERDGKAFHGHLTIARTYEE